MKSRKAADLLKLKPRIVQIHKMSIHFGGLYYDLTCKVLGHFPTQKEQPLHTAELNPYIDLYRNPSKEQLHIWAKDIEAALLKCPDDQALRTAFAKTIMDGTHPISNCATLEKLLKKKD